MIDFLKGHFRYYDRCRSYARNVKVHHLDLGKEEREACYALLDVDRGSPWDASGYNARLMQFAESYSYRWQIGTYGRSGGYLVLITGERKLSEYKQVCEDCDQRNYSVDAKVCGVCGSTAMVPFKGYEIVSFPYKGTDEEKDWEDWEDDRLDSRMDLVKDFDEACDEAVKLFVAYAMDNRVVEKTIMVPQTTKVMVPRKKKKRG